MLRKIQTLQNLFVPKRIVLSLYRQPIMCRNIKKFIPHVNLSGREKIKTILFNRQGNMLIRSLSF